MLCCRCIPPMLHRAYQHPRCPACRTSGCSATDTKSPQSQNDLRRTLRKRGPSATARGRQNSTQCSTHGRDCQAQELPACIRPCSGHGGVLGTTRTWGFSQDELACQGSWVINISLHSLPALFLAWGRAVEAFPQLFQHMAALWGARGSQAVPLSALGMHRASSCPSCEPEPSPGAEHPSPAGHQWDVSTSSTCGWWHREPTCCGFCFSTPWHGTPKPTHPDTLRACSPYNQCVKEAL